MFSWNISGAVFPRLAIKHLLKFVLKKYGKLIQGDLDLDQLDVQFRAGTIQLNNLALNADFINQQLGASQIIVREGSIGSFSFKIPSRLCELDELEIVLVPRAGGDLSSGDETLNATKDRKQHLTKGSEKLNHEMMNSASQSVSLDVHEGVKKIAKMVKWLLTGLRVNVKKLIVAYDPCSDKDERLYGCHRALVLRINEIEYGTCVSENTDANPHGQVENFLGMTRLANFVRFEGAILELLEMDDVDNHTQVPSALETSFNEQCSGSLPSHCLSPILTGESGGFSGNLKFSIPWKDCSFDINKVDADILIDPLELRVKPSTIMWVMHLYHFLTNLEKDGQCHVHCKEANSVYYNSASQFHSSVSGSVLVTTDGTMNGESIKAGLCSPASPEPRTSNSLLRELNVIPDWVPMSNANRNEKVKEEPDLSASIDQFFECFDGLRNSQSALSNSGMWNWTCSVFSAITAASSLASGSIHIPPGQVHFEINLRATIRGISISLLLHDENPQYSCDFLPEFASGDQSRHHLEAKCRDVLLVLQTHSHDMKFEAKIKHIELDDYFRCKNEAAVFGSSSKKNCHTGLVEKLQERVQGALPLCQLFSDPDSEETIIGSSMNEILGSAVQKTTFDNAFARVKLLKTSGMTSFEVISRTTHLNGDLSSSVHFTLNLPPLIVWVNFGLVSMLLDLSKQLGSYSGLKKKKKFTSEYLTEKLDPVCQKDAKRSDCSCLATFPSKRSLTGRLFPSNTRIILCFPFENYGDSEQYFCWDQFIGLDIVKHRGKERISGACDRNSKLQQEFCNKVATTIHLTVDTLNVYLITSDCKHVDSSSVGKLTFSTQQVLSITNGTDHFSGISMLWQDGSVTDPLIAKRVGTLANSQDSRSRNSMGCKGYEFASATTLGDLEDRNFRTRKEIILSSEFLLDICLPPVSIKIERSQYVLLCHMVNRVMDLLSCATLSTSRSLGEDSKKEVAPISQTSVRIKCDSVKFVINLGEIEESTSPLQKELPGSWQMLKLEVKKLVLLSVSDIGGVNGCNLFWLSHGEGQLWGTVDEFPFHEFLLISCNNSTMGRGDGEGSNVLSLGTAGTDVVFLSDPLALKRSTCITIKGSTILAPGGRLDWFSSICYFFSPSDCENDQTCDDAAGHKSSFVLNLVDTALGYEPYINNLAASHQNLESGSNNSAKVSEKQYVACLLASASVNLSNQMMASPVDNDYKIRLQDLGLLLCPWSAPKEAGVAYDIEYLNRSGYVKVAGEALAEAVLRTNCMNGPQWEVLCSDSHINMDTCSDATSGLLRLAAQLQQIYAPDMQESMVHLQSRWKAVQEAQRRPDVVNEMNNNNSGSSSSSPSHAQKNPSQGTRGHSGRGMAGLMDEISEDAFNFKGNGTSASDGHELKSHNSVDEDLLGNAVHLKISNANFFSQSVSSNSYSPRMGSESDQEELLQKDFFSELIEGYCITGVYPLSETSREASPTNSDLRCKSRDERFEDVRRGDSAWYRYTSPRIVENYIPSVSEKSVGSSIPEASKLTSICCKKADELCNARGRIILKNIGIRWRMHAGSDWHNMKKNTQHTATTEGRDAAQCLELTLSGVDVVYDLYPDGDVQVSKLSLSVQDFHLYDRSMNAPWKLVLGYHHSKDHPRESSAKAFKLDLEAVRPDPSIPLEEYRLRVAFLPIVLHLDQDQLDFLICFFGGGGLPSDQSPALPHDPYGSRIFDINIEGLFNLFAKFDMWPSVVRVDYSPRHVDLAALRGGNYVHLINLFPWKGIELHLKHVNAVGIYGWGSVCETIFGEWLEDISNNQIRKFLKGLPPIRSLFSVGSGAAKLVSLPVNNYRKDRRLLKGIQRGAVAFLRSISLEAIGLGVHLTAGAHDVLLQTEYILTSFPPSVTAPARIKTETSVRSNQPEDAQQGIQQAYESLSDGFSRTASALVGTPLKEYQRGAGAGSALASAVCAAPAAAIAPASATMRALHCALLGVRNKLDPEHKKESMEKYLGHVQRQDRS
ncbi:hypothetical protein Sjap_017239 [Stephania japonica]|uniref:Autophagy-related protein 2 n=1 Tax=Stephania japonica TaxID=461633 RepID=A0AAP0NJN6_9MAGN